MYKLTSQANQIAKRVWRKRANPIWTHVVDFIKKSDTWQTYGAGKMGDFEQFIKVEHFIGQLFRKTLRQIDHS